MRRHENSDHFAIQRRDLVTNSTWCLKKYPNIEVVSIRVHDQDLLSNISSRWTNRAINIISVNPRFARSTKDRHVKYQVFHTRHSIFSVPAQFLCFRIVILRHRHQSMWTSLFPRVSRIRVQYWCLRLPQSVIQNGLRALNTCEKKCNVTLTTT